MSRLPRELILPLAEAAMILNQPSLLAAIEPRLEDPGRSNCESMQGNVQSLSFDLDDVLMLLTATVKVGERDPIMRLPLVYLSGCSLD